MENILARLHRLLRATRGVCALLPRGYMQRTGRRANDRMVGTDFKDELTGVGNRYAYISRLEGLGRESLCALGVIDVDINGLRLLNERFGYRYGDLVLRDTATVLARRADGQVYRVGEDEFSVLYCGGDRAGFDAVCASIREAFARTRDYSATISCTWWENEIHMDRLLAKVRGRMEAEKAVYYQDAKEAECLPEQGNIASELLREIEAGRFHVYCQPQVDMATGQVVGAEALLRKEDGAGGMIPPGDFVPLYEALGVQVHLDMFVLNVVADMLARFQAEGRALTISVNISRPTLHLPDFVDRVLSALRSRGVRPEYLKLEFTESVARDGMDALGSAVKALRKAGVAVALDDFGTQYANLSVIMDIGFDEIKLDKSLIDHVCTEQRSQIVLQSVIDMCRRLDNRRIVAEGIERPEQSEKLQSMSCRYGQGYLYYKPMPMDEFIRMNEGKGHADSTTHAD